jgi:hypothetical protein
MKPVHILLTLGFLGAMALLSWGCPYVGPQYPTIYGVPSPTTTP